MTYIKKTSSNQEETYKVNFPWIPVIAFLTGFAGMRIGLDILRYKRQQVDKNSKLKKEGEDVS